MIPPDQDAVWCDFCGSILDAEGNHTPEWKGSRKIDGKWRRAKLHRCHANIIQRTTNPNDHNWRYYGARGIKICDEWRWFPGFRAWALANGYAPGLVIDRIDSDQDYCPENCRWILSEDNQPQRKLTHEQVRAIRKSTESTVALGKRYGVHTGHISNIRNGKAWVHLETEDE